MRFLCDLFSSGWSIRNAISARPVTGTIKSESQPEHEELLQTGRQSKCSGNPSLTQVPVLVQVLPITIAITMTITITSTITIKPSKYLQHSNRGYVSTARAPHLNTTQDCRALFRSEVEQENSLPHSTLRQTSIQPMC